MLKIIIGTVISVVSIIGCYIGGYVTGNGLGELLTKEEE